MLKLFSFGKPVSELLFMENVLQSLLKVISPRFINRGLFKGPLSIKTIPPQPKKIAKQNKNLT